MKTYDIGDTIILTGVWEDLHARRLDPDTVGFSLLRPDRTRINYTYGSGGDIKKTEVGVYQVEFDATIPGVHYYRFWSTGTGKAAGETSFQIRESKILG